MDTQIKKLLEKWHLRVRLSQNAHYEAAKRVRWMHQILGVQAVIIPSIVGTALFAFLGNGVFTSILMVLGVLCILSSVEKGKRIP